MSIFGVECLKKKFNCEFLLISFLFSECFPFLYPNLENDALLCFEMSAAYCIENYKMDLSVNSWCLHTFCMLSIDVDGLNHFPDDFEDLPKRNESARYRRRERVTLSPRVSHMTFQLIHMYTTRVAR